MNNLREEGWLSKGRIKGGKCIEKGKTCDFDLEAFRGEISNKKTCC